jgi:acyl-CoA synthetase (AMP-forming)/AMP-acid ligase II
MFPDGPGFIEAFAGTMQQGAVPLSVNPLLPAHGVVAVATARRSQTSVLTLGQYDHASARPARAGAPPTQQRRRASSPARASTLTVSWPGLAFPPLGTVTRSSVLIHVYCEGSLGSACNICQ